MNHVLIVEDEPRILTALTISVRAAGDEVTTARTGAEALESARRRLPDLVLLDLGLPDGGGLGLISGLRAWTHVPIIVLCGRTGRRDNASAALDAGADDYLLAPFDAEDLLFRLRALRRDTSGTGRRTRVTVGDLVVDLAARTVVPVSPGADPPSRGAVPVARGADAVPGRDLTSRQWALLELLVGNPGRLLSHAELARRGWEGASREPGTSVRACLAELRRLFEPDPTRPRYLITEPGLGYRFRP